MHREGQSSESTVATWATDSLSLVGNIVEVQLKSIMSSSRALFVCLSLGGDASAQCR